jgi:hypothetical protein
MDRMQPSPLTDNRAPSTWTECLSHLGPLIWSPTKRGPYGLVFAHRLRSLAIINAGGGAAIITPNSIAAAFGRRVGARLREHSSSPDHALRCINIVDSSNVSRMARLFYVSPNQIKKRSCERMCVHRAVHKVKIHESDDSNTGRQAFAPCPEA